MSTLAAREEYAGVGPVESEARQRLGPVLDGAWSLQIAPKSPIGPGALKVQLDGDASGVAESLEREPWVEAIAVRPRHIYMRVGTAELRSWIASGFEERVAHGSEGRGTSALVRVEEGDPESLTDFRGSVVAATVTKIVASRGYEVRLESARGASEPLGDRETAQEIVVAGAPASDRAALRLAVGEVDVPFGPLRMRYGGLLNVEDAAEELARIFDEEKPERAGLLAEDQALDALTVLMLATPRAKHVHIDDNWIRQGATAIGHLAAALSASSPGEDESTEGELPEADQAAHKLAIELNALPKRIAHSLAGLEPAYLARFALSLAASASSARLQPSDPLRGATAAAIRSALDLLVPLREGQAERWRWRNAERAAL